MVSKHRSTRGTCHRQALPRPRSVAPPRSNCPRAERKRPGGAWPLNLDGYLGSDRSAEAFWSTALRSPALASLPEMRVRASTTAKIVNAPCRRATSRASLASVRGASPARTRQHGRMIQPITACTHHAIARWVLVNFGSPRELRRHVPCQDRSGRREQSRCHCSRSHFDRRARARSNARVERQDAGSQHRETDAALQQYARIEPCVDAILRAEVSEFRAV